MMKKRILSLSLALLMIFALLPFGAFAAESFAPFDKLVRQVMYETEGTVYATFFDFDEDGKSEIVLARPAYNGMNPKAQIFKWGVDGKGEYYYYTILDRSFDVVPGSESEYTVVVVENEHGEAGVLLHTEGVNTIDDNPRYQGLVDDFTRDELFIWRDGRFVQDVKARSAFWHTVPDAGGNVYYDPGQCDFIVNDRDYSLEEFGAWYDGFLNSLGSYGMISPYAAMDGLEENELLSLTTVGFYDVLYTLYYVEPVKWAAANGITNGTSDYTFSPEDPCTRAQVVTFLWRAAGSPEPKSRVNPFTDVNAGDYYGKAVLWAVEQGITNGIDPTHFGPDQPCTRAHVVTFLWRSHGKPAAGGATPFTDVEPGAYYADAVRWAVSKNITNGIDATHFGPESTCIRGQIVTFLYRDLAK